MKRDVLPEILDELSANDPEAEGSRRDLQRLNVRMKSAALIAQVFKETGIKAPVSLLEIGAGDGTLLLEVVRILGPAWNGSTITLLDRQAIVSDETRAAYAARGWTASNLKADILEWAPGSEGPIYDVMISNLFLHHFEDKVLKGLLGQLSRRTRMLITLEPRRWQGFMWVTRMLWAMGCNRVTRHDAQVSVRAGFRDKELSALWPAHETWSIREETAGWFSHLFVAAKKPGAP